MGTRRLPGLLVFAVLTLLGVSCDSAEPTYRVALPEGWIDQREHRSEFQEGMNAQAPRWARLRVRQLAKDSSSGATIAVAAFARPPHGSLDALADRMIRLGNDAVINFALRQPPTPATVDGAPALFYDYTASPSFGAVYVRVAVIRKGTDVHLVSVTATPHGFRDGASRLAEVLDSWRWT